MVREGQTTTLKAVLSAVGDQIGRWPVNSEMERTIPQVRFASGIEIIKLPLGLRYILAREANVLKRAMQACELIYAEWYHNQLETPTLTEIPRALSVSLPALGTCFGLGWNLDVLTDDFKLNNAQVQRRHETLAAMTITEVPALPLTLGHPKFVAHPLAIIVGLVADCNPIQFFTYLVLAQGKMRSQIGLCEALFIRDNQDYTEPLWNLLASLQHWVYSSWCSRPACL